MEEESGTATLTRIKLKKPSKYGVYILNDGYTTWQFVVIVLIKIFNKTEEDATAITKRVHNGGEGLCGVYTKEIAESKVQAAKEFSQLNNQPLRTVMRPI